MKTCWQLACRTEIGCEPHSFVCDDLFRNTTSLNDLCPINPQNETLFDFGIFVDVLKSGISKSTNHPQKFSNCFWWGLRNLRFVNLKLIGLAYILLWLILTNKIHSTFLLSFQNSVFPQFLILCLPCAQCIHSIWSEFLIMNTLNLKVKICILYLRSIFIFSALLVRTSSPVSLHGRTSLRLLFLLLACYYLYISLEICRLVSSFYI